MVPDSYHVASQRYGSPHSSGNSAVAYATMVPSSHRTSGGLSSKDSTTTGSSFNIPGPRVHNAAGQAPVNHVAYLRESTTFFNKLWTSCLPHGETKSIQTTDHHPLNGLTDVSNGIEILFRTCRRFWPTCMLRATNIN